MSEYQLSRSFRPKAFDDMVGQEKLIDRIKGYLKKRTPRCWMFTGESGAGKTTLARIMALSFQCKHHKFGYPCKKCYKNKDSFDITEVNASKDTGKERMEKIIAGSDYYPKHGSRYRVYILDEFQKLSDGSQSMLLKCLEESPKSTIWILCTSHSEDVIKAMWRRVISLGLKPLDETGIRTLVQRTLKHTKSDQEISAMKLSEALIENGITSPGFIVKAVENRLAGNTDEEAAIVEYTSSFNPRPLTKSLIKGNWSDVRKELATATAEDARSIRASVSALLSTILIESEEMGDSTTAVSKAIHRMCEAQGENSVILASVRASCYELCKIFQKYSR